jgi:hypothetical protein
MPPFQSDSRVEIGISFEADLLMPTLLDGIISGIEHNSRRRTLLLLLSNTPRVSEMIQDEKQQFSRGILKVRFLPSEREHVSNKQVKVSEWLRLRKTSTKPAEFSCQNRRTQTYCINSIVREVWS